MDENNDVTTFEQLGVAPELLKAINELGFEHPMPIQEMVIPHLLDKEGDVIGLAQTGTGKTAAFGLPLLQRIDSDTNQTQALIIAPTRELCLQIAGDLADFSKYQEKIRILPVYGGSSIESQIRTLRKGVQVIVATPGRLIDLIKRGEVSLDNVHTVILDEADEMLNMGFIDDINEILKHIYYMVKAHDKYLALKRIADNNPDIYGIIFCRTRKETQEIADKLIADGYNADCLHGDLSQQQRDLAMKKFRDHVTQLLVATDVAARGLDVDDLTHVINYGLPDDAAVYTHRSGRTGRARKTGVSVAIIHSREKGRLREIEKIIGKQFEYRKIPTPEHIIEKQLYNLADRLERVEVNESEIEKYLPGVRKKLEWLSEQDLLKRVLSLEFNRLLKYYRDMPDIDLNETERGGTRRDKGEKRQRGEKMDKDRRTAPEGMERLMLNIGKAQGFFPGNLMELVNRSIVGPKPEIGRIDLLPDYTLFDVRKGDAHRILDSLRNADFFGQKVRAEVATNRNYTLEAKNRREKQSRRRAAKDEAADNGKRGTKRASRGETKARKKNEAKPKRPEYNGNYDIFINKKKH